MENHNIVIEQFDFRRDCYITGLKRSLYEIRENIKKKVFLEEKWVNYGNCYTFALGLDYDEYELKYNAYYPGTIGNSKTMYGFGDDNLFMYEDLIKNMVLDFNMLGISHRQINTLDTISEKEWKIAIFIKESLVDGYSEDYHFMRQFKNGKWYHKFGEYGKISECDDNGIIITNPTNCYIKKYIYKDCLSLSLKNEHIYK